VQFGVLKHQTARLFYYAIVLLLAMNCL